MKLFTKIFRVQLYHKWWGVYEYKTLLFGFIPIKKWTVVEGMGPHSLVDIYEKMDEHGQKKVTIKLKKNGRTTNS